MLKQIKQLDEITKLSYLYRGLAWSGYRRNTKLYRQLDYFCQILMFDSKKARSLMKTHTQSKVI
jgi:hypothetical protein